MSERGCGGFQPIGPMLSINRPQTHAMTTILHIDSSILGAHSVIRGFTADVIVIGAPMYNFAVPSQLMAWIDRVCVAGKTVRDGPNGPEGLVKGKTVYVGSTRGGVCTGDSPIAGLDHQESDLRVALGGIGLTDVTIVRVEGLAKGGETKDHAVAGAKAQGAALAA